MNSDKTIFNDGRKSKFGDILRRPRDDVEISLYSPDIEFSYDDSDSLEAELAELYSYTEEAEFVDNKECFEELMASFMGGQSKWTCLANEKRRNFVLHLINLMDTLDVVVRIRAVRCALYLCQGTFSECGDVKVNLDETRKNVLLLNQCGLFSACTSLLLLEINNQNQSVANSQKPAVSINDSLYIRCIMNVMYIMIEILRRNEPTDTQQIIIQREDFKNDLIDPVYVESSLLVVLFEIMAKFCSGSAPHFPMKKTLLLIWKIILTTLGGLDTIHDQKNKMRESMKLPVLNENTHEVCRRMRASSPPASATDFIEQHQLIKRRPPMQKSGLLKQTNMDGDMEFNMEEDSYEEGSVNASQIVAEESMSNLPRPSTPLQAKGLPWTPKVRQKELENFLDQTRNKFVGFNVKNDIVSLIGLPHPICEGVKVLNQHIYVSLSELQIKREEEINKYPLSMPEGKIPETRTEILYRSNYASLPQYMISLLKILLASAPTSKTKSESVNILSDLLPEESPSSVLQSMKLGMDINRHKEIIVKAISAIILLLLKHFKINHIYQFEFMSQHLVFANCVPLVLKFFNQNISSYVTAKNTIPLCDFPNCLVCDAPEITAESLEAGDSQLYCWRNLFASINLLRILNKLTKWKHSRTMMLVVFKSAPILKRALKVRQAMMQLYILKLLKMQTKYLGRQWRKSNMKTMSAIYQKVRHRLTDDWAYGNDVDARPWDFQAEESSLRNAVEKFNSRRYDPNYLQTPDYIPVDKCLQSVLSQRVDLTEDFKKNYESWLEAEVFNNKIQWEQVLRQ